MNRVIFCLNNNPTYKGFWEINSKVFRHMGYVPTLIFYGTDKDRQELSLEEHGEVITLPSVTGLDGGGRNWAVTWGLFYGASLFSCCKVMTHGIDQIPLSNYFKRLFDNCYTDKYYVGFADAYRRKDLFPSSHHIAFGAKYQEVFNIDRSWEQELKKVHEFGKQTMSGDLWGLDEAYSSAILNRREDIVFVKDLFFNFVVPNRLDRSGNLTPNIDKLRNGGYSEIHCPRPYLSHKTLIDSIINEIL